MFKSGSGPLGGNLWTAGKGFVKGTLGFVRVALPLLQSGYERLSEKVLVTTPKLWSGYGQRPWVQGAVGDKVQEPN